MILDRLILPSDWTEFLCGSASSVSSTRDAIGAGGVSCGGGVSC